MRRSTYTLTGSLILGALLLAGCDRAAPEETFQPGDRRQIPINDRSQLAASQDSGYTVNKDLWNAAIDVIAFLPITAIDPFNGSIATGWGSLPGAGDDRFRATVSVLSEELSVNALSVALARQSMDADGAWIDLPVAEETVRGIEDAIFLRARENRIAR